MVDRTVEKRMEPVIKMLMKNQKRRTSVTEVVGAVGYIFGLMGLWLFFMSRRKEKE